MIMHPCDLPHYRLLPLQSGKLIACGTPILVRLTTL
jgi:hypothetical protein